MYDNGGPFKNITDDYPRERHFPERINTSEETPILVATPPEAEGSKRHRDGPQTLIEYEHGADVEQDGGPSTEAHALSPFDEFRRRQNYLSVSDLVGPAWCEVSYDYGLRQGRSWDIKSRPTTFKTSAGKEIKVNTNQAKRNDKAMKGGTAVHEKLEKQLHPVKVTVKTKTREDKWGLRLLDMASRMETLIHAGSCRELPVFGILQGEVVIGVIDEIRHGGDSLSLVDNKTRKNGQLAPFSETLRDRLQLMLYWQLLSQLISISKPFAFERVWEQLHVDPSKPFSERFVEDRKDLLGDGDAGVQGDLSRAMTLGAMVEPFREIIQFLGVGGQVDNSLRLIYWKRQPSPGVATSQAKSELAAIKNALAQLAEGAGPSTQSTVSPESPVADGETLTQRLKARKSEKDKSHSQSEMIGTRKFFVKKDVAESYVKDVLQWWRGERPPRGVELDQTKRCNSCEYRDGCEWLEAKAEEMAEKRKAVPLTS